MDKKEYDRQFKEYLKENGPNPGVTFFGAWGWHSMMKKRFDNQLKEQNGREERT